MGRRESKFRINNREVTTPMVNIPVLRWGQPYTSVELDNVIHFITGETLARVSQANPGLLAKDMRRAQRAREALREIPCRELVLNILTRGYGVEPRGVTVSYQAQAPALGMVLPSNSPGVHTLWLPVIPMQIGLVLKPGPQEPWTPYRMAAAFFEAGVPKEAISIYPGLGDVGAEVVRHTNRSMIFGGTATVEHYKGDRRVQVHGPGFSKILLGDDVVDQWEKHLDVIVDSVFLNSGRGCINCSGIWASRHTREIAA